ncbi:MAG: cupin domain-containing protein [Candidatus Liptonbacteria bacterium]|nr:cupin domain-containing protein [Candidatus Liptonbacteria bacterium]
MVDFRGAIQKFKNAKVVVIGDIMLDRYTYGDVERVSPEASVPVVLKVSEKFTLGGAGNVADNLVALGADVELAGVVGKDEAGELVMKLLKEKGIGAAAVVMLPHRPTIEKHRIVASGNHQLLRLDRESKDPMSPEEEDRGYRLLEPAVRRCDAVIFSDYGKGFFSERFARKIVARAKSERKLMLADFNTAKHKKYFIGVDVVTPNLKEAREFTGLHAVEEIGPQLVSDFGAHVVLTRGGEGMSLFRREDASHHHTPGKKVSVFDVSGAGDTSISVLALGMAAGGLDIADAVALANEASALVVQKPGTAAISPEELASVVRGDNHLENVARVPKVWGYEQWLENNEKYCCKVLALNKGYQCSLHYHKKKDETFLVTAGHVRLELGDEVLHLRPGTFVRVPPNTRHRFAGIEDSAIIEVSTHHDEADSFRIEESRKMDA